jgi:hypothetical protein
MVVPKLVLNGFYSFFTVSSVREEQMPQRTQRQMQALGHLQTTKGE